MIALFQNLYNIIEALVTFVINSIQAIYIFIINLPDYITFIVTSINTLPSLLIPFCVASIYISVVLLLLGRNS